MPLYEYTGQLPSGTAISGTFEASGPDDAQRKLSDLEVHVTALQAADRMPSLRPLSREDVLFFNEQLASLAQSGIALDQGLRVIARDLRRGRLRRVIEELAAAVERGIPFDEAVRRRVGLFPPLYAEVLRAGAQNQQLGSTLCNLSTHLSLMDAGRRLFWESATYPLIILALGFGLLTAFLTVIVPQFESLMVEFGSSGFTYYDSMTGNVVEPSLGLGHPTHLLFQLARAWPWIAAGVLIAVPCCALLWRFLALFGAGREFREALVFAIPGFGGVFRMSLLARFAQAGALAARAGQDLPGVLRLSAGATGSARLARDAERLSSHIEQGGSSIAASLSTNLIPAIFAFTAHVAGSRGQLAPALADMARGWDELARHRLTMVRLLLIPFLIVVTAVILGGGVLALFLPLVSLINSMTGG